MKAEEEIRRLVTRVVDQTFAGDVGCSDAIAIGCDHGGFGMKELLKTHLENDGKTVRDCGTHSTDSVDYPDLAHAVAELVGRGTYRWGIIVDGAGIGSAMVANKVPGVRAALCYDLSSARNSREHNTTLSDDQPAESDNTRLSTCNANSNTRFRPST